MFKRLDYMPYAQAKVTYYDCGAVELTSYVTCVCYISEDGWLDCTGTYSQTTRKHIGAWCKEINRRLGCNIDYYTCKGCYMGNYIYNIYTGEIIEKVA